jgi:hypothetical protein
VLGLRAEFGGPSGFLMGCDRPHDETRDESGDRRGRFLSYKVMIDVLRQQNAETIHRLIEQGVLLLRAYHAEYESDPAGPEAEFLRGTSQAGAILYTRCTTEAPKKSLTVWSPEQACLSQQATFGRPSLVLPRRANVRANAPDARPTHRKVRDEWRARHPASNGL